MGRFDGTRVAVTGAGGFIGGAAARRFAAEGAEVVGIDVSPNAAGRLAEDGIEPRSPTSPPGGARARARRGGPRHPRRRARPRVGRDGGVRALNVGGTAAVLDAAAAAGAARVVHVSSVVVFGYDDPAEQTEAAHRPAMGSPTSTPSPRPTGSRRAVARSSCGRATSTGRFDPLARAPAADGAGRPAQRPGGGDGLMLPVYIDDLVEALVLAAERGAAGPHTPRGRACP